MKWGLMIGIAVVALAFCQAPTADAYAGDCQEEGGFVIASDTAPIISNDVDQAKNVAVWGAMRRALECKGVNIDAETVQSLGLPVADYTSIQVDGYIKDWELVSGQSGVIESGYHATIKAWVKSGREFEKEQRNILSIYKVLFIAENKAAKAVEKTLTAQLNRVFGTARTHDSDFVNRNVSQQVWRQLCNRSLYDLDQSAFKFDADLVIHIQSTVESLGASDSIAGVDKYSGAAAIRLFRLSGERKGEAIIEASHDSERIFIRHRGSEAAQRRMLYDGDHPNGFKRQVTLPVSEAFMERLMNCKLFAIRDRTITVVIRNVPSPNAYKKFLYLVKKQRGVMDRVTEKSQQGNTYTIDVQFPMKTVYLANLIAQNKTYRRIGYGWNRIEFEYNEKES